MFRAVAVTVGLCAVLVGSPASPLWAGPPGPGPVTIFGLLHTPLGQAVLDTSGGMLRVSNIGSSGQDGVSVNVDNETFGFRQEFGPVAGNRRITSSSNDGLGLHDLELVTLADGFMRVHLDTTLLNPQSVRVVAFLDGAPVDDQVFTPPPSALAPLFSADLGQNAKDGVRLELHGRTRVDSFFDICYRIAVPTTIGPTQVQADRVEVHLLDLPPGTPETPGVANVQITAHDLPSFDLTGAALEQFDAFHTALGEALLSTPGGHLVVSNIGSSGKDGVRVEHGTGGGGGGGRIAVRHGFIDDDDDGDVIYDVLGHGTGGPAVFAHMAVQMGPLVTSVTPLFPLHTGQVEVTLRDGGLVVGSGVLDPDEALPLSAATAGERPIIEEAEASLQFDGFRLHFSNDITGFGEIGDTVTFNPLATGGVAGPDIIEIDAMDIKGDGSGDIDIMGVEGVTCPEDTNGSGAVDVDDLINVIIDWGTDGFANGGDVNGSGLVDVDDLVAVILAWGPC